MQRTLSSPVEKSTKLYIFSTKAQALKIHEMNIKPRSKQKTLKFSMHILPTTHKHSGPQKKKNEEKRK